MKHQMIPIHCLKKCLHDSGETESSESYIQDQQTLVTIPAIVTNTARLASLGIVSELFESKVSEESKLFLFLPL